MKLFFKRTLSVALISVFLVSCSPKTIEEYQTQTDEFLAKGEKQSAIIVLKDGIQKFPDEASLRFQLGSIYLSRGDILPALKELGLAKKWAYNPEQVLKLEIRAKFRAKDFAEVTDLAQTESSLEPSDMAYVLSFQSIAYLELQDKENAVNALTRAVESDPDSVYVKLAQSYLLVFENKESEALVLISEVLQQEPELPEAVLLEGVLISNSGDTAEAVLRFEKYQKLMPGIIESKLILANAYVDNGQYEEAEKLLDQLLKVSETQPLLNQLKAIVRFHADDFSNAKIYAERSMQYGLDNYASRVIAGMSAMELGVYEQAYNHLSAIDKSLASNSPARKALTFAQIKLGYTVNASDVDYSENPTLNDFNLASMAAIKLIQEDKLQEARSVFAQVSEVELTTAKDLAKKGLVDLSMKEQAKGIENLNEALKVDPLLEEARVGLAAHYMENKDYEKAIEVTQQWLDLDPNSVQAYGLLAIIAIAQKDSEAAEKSYKKIAELDPSRAGPKIFFAVQHIINGELQEAADLYEEVLDLNPTHIATLNNYFMVSDKLGKVRQATDRAAVAYSKDKTNTSLKGIYSMTLGKIGNFDEIVSIWQNTSPNKDAPNVYWSSMGDAYLGLGEIDKAKLLYKKWLDVSPNSRLPYIRSAAFYEILKDYEAALNIIESGLRIKPADKQFLLLKASLLLSNKQPDLAADVISKLPESLDSSLSVISLNAQLLLQQNDVVAALPMLEEVYAEQDSLRNLGFLISAYTKVSKSKEATQLLESRVEKYPKEILPKLLLADFYGMASADKALSLYQDVISLDSNHIMALNNAAWINHINDQGETAETLAEQAYKLSPMRPSIHNTYGEILLKNGKSVEGLKVMEGAFRLQPSSSSIAVNYAKALIANDRQSDAIEILNKISTANAELNKEIAELKKN